MSYSPSLEKSFSNPDVLVWIKMQNLFLWTTKTQEDPQILYDKMDLASIK